jgi:Ca-activated chloride channel family protein
MALSKRVIITCMLVLFWATGVALSQVHVSTIRVDVDLITVNVSVTDSNNRPVLGLGPGHFQLWEDKVQQEIEYFSDEDVPLSVGIIFDVSSSMKEKIAASRAAAAVFLQTGNTTDEYFLIEFSDVTKLTQDYTTDIRKLQTRIISAVAQGKTALFDAVYLGLEKLRSAHNPRKALLLITDGDDNHSRYSLSDIKEAMREQDVQIYTIGVGLESYIEPTGAVILLGRDAIDGLEKAGSGQSFFPETPEELQSVCATIAQQLKTEYVIGYKSNNPEKNGKWRKIRVKLIPPKGMNGLGLRFRSGYYAATN